MKIVKRILLVLLGIVFVLVLGIAGLIGSDALFSGRSAAQFTNVTYTGANNVPLRAYIAKPNSAGPHPAMLMIHEFYGLNADIVAKANKLAAEGYVVLAVDAYRNATTESVVRAIYLVSSTPGEQIQADLDAGYKYLAAQPEVDPKRIGVMGFCFGGGHSLRQGIANPNYAATVVFYGSLVTNANDLGALKGPVLGIFGEQDRAPSPEQAGAFKTALETKGIKNQVTVYSGVGHAFLNSENISQAGPAGTAWKELLAFLELNLKKK